MNNDLFKRQGAQGTAVADSTKKESSVKELNALSKNNAMVIRDFLMSVAPYEVEALRIALVMSEENRDFKSLSFEDKIKFNDYLDSAMTEPYYSLRCVQEHRLHRLADLMIALEKFLEKRSLLKVYEEFAKFAADSIYVESAYEEWDKEHSCH